MPKQKLSLVSRNDELEHQIGDDTAENVKQSLKEWVLEAWKFTLTSGTFVATLILLINAITLIVISAKYPLIDGKVTFFTGSCQTTSTVNTVAHVVINVLSTILFAYSNFGIQCLSSPSRKEIQVAHDRKKWLSIGTPNIRNLFFISREKLCIILLLIVSSFPLHTFWNAVVFETITTNDYLAVVATENFITGADWTLPLHEHRI